MLWFSLLVGAHATPLADAGAADSPAAPARIDVDAPSAIVNGQDAAEGVDEVVALGIFDESTQLLSVFCSGSVIQDDWILTAAHCIEETDVVQQSPGLQRVAVWGDDVTRLGPDEIIPWRRALVSPDYNPDPLGITGDAGLVQLERPRADARWVVLRDEPFARSEIGTSIQVFGFGSTSDGAGDAGRKRVTSLPVEDVDESNIITFTPQSNVCSGDSGGPGFAPVAGGREQVGINAFVTPGCVGGRGGSTRVDVHVPWILDNVPGVALDPADLPRDPEDDDDEGPRTWTDFGVGDLPAFAVQFDEERGPGSAGCRTPAVRGPAPAYLVAAFVPLLGLLRRPRARASRPRP